MPLVMHHPMGAPGDWVGGHRDRWATSGPSAWVLPIWQGPVRPSTLFRPSGTGRNANPFLSERMELSVPRYIPPPPNYRRIAGFGAVVLLHVVVIYAFA